MYRRLLVNSDPVTCLTVTNISRKSAAKAMVKLISSNLKHPIFVISDPATGNSVDYAFAEQGIKYSWAIELRWAHRGTEEAIAPAFKRFWTGLIASTKEILEKEGY